MWSQGDEAFSCDTCRGKTPATKHLRLQRLPKVLILHIKRFKYRVSEGGPLYWLRGATRPPCPPRRAPSGTAAGTEGTQGVWAGPEPPLAGSRPGRPHARTEQLPPPPAPDLPRSPCCPLGPCAQDNGTGDKLTAAVSFPLRGLRLHEYASPEARWAAAGQGQGEYDLFAVSNHFGTLGGEPPAGARCCSACGGAELGNGSGALAVKHPGLPRRPVREDRAPLDLPRRLPPRSHTLRCAGGHYTAACHVPAADGGEDWYSFNDEVVTKISQQQVRSPRRYRRNIQDRSSARRERPHPRAP